MSGHAAAFARQADICRRFRSPLAAFLLERCAEDVTLGGPVAALVAGYRLDPVESSLPLRVLAAVHEEALAGRAERLARCYPTLGGIPEEARAWDAFREVVAARRETLRPRLASPPQTNEVQRCAVLVPGLLVAAERTRLPLRILEIGASAGLNLHCDAYRLELPGTAFGPADSPVLLRPAWSGPLPPAHLRLQVAERRGCDLRPVTLSEPGSVLRLESYVWCDRADRLARLRAAVAVAARRGVRVDAESAGTWLERELAAQAPGRATVVVHSSVWAYLDAATRERVAAAIAAAGRAATADTPLCWLRFEDPPGGVSDVMELRLSCWPGGSDELLATAHSHGEWVRSVMGPLAPWS